MPPPSTSHERAHKLLLLQKLLSLRDGASPFTLLLDSLEQSSEPVVREFILKATTGIKSKIVLVSLQTLRKPENVHVFINACRKPLGELRQEIASHISPAQSQFPKNLLIFDSLNALAIRFSLNLAEFLASLLGPNISILATYHTDIPIPQNAVSSSRELNPYSPDALTTLKYLATAILCIFNFAQALERKKARDRSLEEPVFGLQERKEGILVGLQGGAGESLGGVVLEMEVRRKSGRGVTESYVLSTGMTESTSTSKVGPAKTGSSPKICLLDDHPLFAPTTTALDDDGNGEGDVETTFNLGLTEQQRTDRAGVVLPYFDAQRGEGAGDGGRILYEMDRGDDFDEEEDEI